jgi:hypothetical protein
MREATQDYDLQEHLERCLRLDAQRTKPDRTRASISFMRAFILGRHQDELRLLEGLTGYEGLAESILLEKYCEEHGSLPKHVHLMKTRIQEGCSRA